MQIRPATPADVTIGYTNQAGTSGQSTGAIAMTPVAAAGNKVAFSMPKTRFTGVDHGERAGALVWQLKGEALRSANAGNDEVSVVLT